jgi:hypothetical protein
VAAGDGTPGDGTPGDGTAGDGTAGDGTAGDDTVPDAASEWFQRRAVIGWAEAVLAADRLQADYPGWHVRAVARRTGPGVAAQRDGHGLCLMMGSPGEVRELLEATVAAAEA